MLDLNGEVLKGGEVEVAEEIATVGMRVHPHAPVSDRTERSQFGDEMSLAIEELLRPIAAEPFIEDAQMFGVGLRMSNRDLMGSPGVLYRLAVDDLRTGPSL